MTHLVACTWHRPFRGPLLTGLTVLLGILLCGSDSGADEPATEAFALVVAHNQSSDPTLKVLHYADDDGARFYEWASTFARRVELLAVLDAGTQRTFPALVGKSRLPSRTELGRAMATLGAEIAAARSRGARTVFYFYFAGHGGVGADRVGYIELHDGRFSRTDLYAEVIARSGADTNHVVIDACSSYFLVNRRGDGPRTSAEEAMRSFLSEESLDRHPNTGVLLSTATMSDSHEWSRYQSGIFSHQLLSALWGSADVDGDQRVSYAELGAYVAAANLRVRDSRARLNVFARPPRRDRQAALVDLRLLQRVQSGTVRPQAGRVAGLLTVPDSLHGHYYLEDDRGVRYADFNKSAEQPLRIALLDRPYYYLRSEEREALIRLEVAGDLDASQVAFAEIPTRSRGAVEQSFRTDLYAFPFGRSFAAGHAAAFDLEGTVGTPAGPVDGELRMTPRGWYRRASTWKWITLGTSVASLAAGASLQALSIRTGSQLDSRSLTSRQALDLQDTGNRQRLGAGIAFGLAGGAALGSLVLFLIDRGSPDGRPSRPAAAVRALQPALSPSGATLSFSGRY